MKKDMTKPPRKKAGWRETDRLCGLCGKEIPADKSLQRHHVSYSQNSVRSLHFVCHNLVHARNKFNNPYDKYGKDFGALALALDIIKLYRPVMKEALKHIRQMRGK